VRQKEYATFAEEAGVPLLIDPLTYLVAAELAPDAPWVRYAGFGGAEAVDASAFLDPRASVTFVERVIEFQVQHGATMIIPPYAYAQSPVDPWFEVSIEWIGLTARVLRASGLHLPVAPILCGGAQGFTPRSTWATGLDRFVQAALGIGPSFLGVCLGPMGDGRESYRKLHGLFATMQHLKQSGTSVVAWRQGVYGLALCAAGVDGYECGIGMNERTSVRSAMARQRPRPGRRKGGGGSGRIYLEPLGASVSKNAAVVLLGEDPAMRAKVMCDDPGCCPHGVQSTLDHGWEHTVRSRGRELQSLDALPGTEWRLNQLHVKEQGRLSLRRVANKLLARHELNQIAIGGLEALVRVLDDARREARETAKG